MIPHRPAAFAEDKINAITEVNSPNGEFSKQVEVTLVPDPASIAASPNQVKLPYGALRYGLVATDAILIVVASFLGNAGYQLGANGSWTHTDQFLGAGVSSALIYVMIANSLGSYNYLTIFSTRSSYRRIFTQWSLLSLFLALLVFLMKLGPDFSRGSVVCFAALALVMLMVSHRAAKRAVAAAVSDGRVQGRRAIVIGTRDELAGLDRFELLQRFGLTELERFAIPNDISKNLALGSSEMAVLDRAVARARDLNVHEIVLSVPWSDTRKLELVRDRLRCSPLPIQLMPDRRIRALVGNPSFKLKSSFAVEIQRGPLSRLEQTAKRVVDVGGALLGLLLLSPLMLLAAIVIKLDSSGPVFFRQRRNGFNRNQFRIFKFRTMTVQEDGAVVMQARQADPRVTRVGRVLRRSSIDELPQMLNVLLGHMSLVGPRPHALAHDSQYGDLLAEYAFRHHVKPGITGWAQVRGYRGETSRVEQMKGRVDCDLWYINHWSLVLDLKILMLTCLEVFRRRNAY